jgi:peptidoglycan/xylan/chitin deacetylase (PgdA/CDA1 family)
LPVAPARAGIRRLQSRGREVGCHGYNHDAKWPLLEGAAFRKRLNAVRGFAEEWGVRGFRSEWVWRTQRFLEAIASVFKYDSSIPAMLPAYSHPTRNGCSTCRPYRTYGDLVELPITVALDEWRHLKGLSPAEHFEDIVHAANVVVERGGVVTLGLHPQPHQAANDATFAALEQALIELEKVPGLFRTTPAELAAWVVS